MTLTAANGTLTLGDTTGLTFTTGDGDGDGVMEFTGPLTSINAALDGATFTPGPEYSGPASLRMEVDDQGNTGAGGAQTDDDTLAITVTGDDDPPVHVLPAAQTIAEDSTLTLSGGTAISVSDADAGSAPVSVTLTGTNLTLTLAGTTGLSFTTGDGTGDGVMTFTGTLTDIDAAIDGLVLTPAADHAGSASLRIVTDDLGNTGPGGPRSDDDTLAITVTAVNDPPANVVPGTQTVSGGTPLTLSAGGGNALGVTDPDAGSGTIRLGLAASGGTLTLSGTAGLSFVAGDGSLDTGMIVTGARADVAAALEGAVFLPAAGFSGTATIQIDSDDQGNTGAGGALTDSDSFDVTVTPATSPPVLDPIGAKTVAEGTTLAFTASAGDPDLPGDTLTYSLLGAPSGASINPTTGAFAWTPAEAQGPGSYSFAVIVTDAGGPPASDSETIVVGVTEINATPVLDPIADRANGEGDAVSFAPTGVDPDVPADTLTWSATGLPPGLTMNPITGAVSGTVDAGATAGSPYPVTVTLQDAAGASDSSAFQWSVVLSNSAPVLAPIAPESGDEMSPIVVSAAATDPDADTLAYSLRDAPAGAAIDPDTGRFTWTPTEAQGPGSETITVVATDDGTPSMTAERTLAVTVREANRAPAIDPMADQSVAVGETLRIDVPASDPDRPRNRLTVTVAGPAAMNVDDSGTLTWAPTAGDLGQADVTLTATDDGSPQRADSARLHITITPATAPAPATPATDPGGGGSGSGTPGGAPAPTGPAGGETPPAEPAGEPETPAAPSPPRAGAPGGLTAAQLASRRLGSHLLVVDGPAAGRAPAGSAPPAVSLSTPVRVIAAATELSIPLHLLTLGGAWTSLIVSIIVMRRRNRRPFMVVDIPHDQLLRVLTKRDPDAEPRFLLRHDAGPVWSRGPSRRRRGRRWIEVETPLGPGFADARNLAPPPPPGGTQA